MFHTLLVEDSPTFRESLSESLHSRFPEILIDEAENGDQALRIVGTHMPDMIFMDIKLPGASGLELTKTIKQLRADVVIVMLTSFDLPEYRQAAFRSGADCFISKGGVSCMVDVMARVEGTLATRRLE